MSEAAKLHKLIEVSRTISGNLEFKPLISEVVHQASILVSAARSTLWLYDQRSDELFTFSGEGLQREFRNPLNRGFVGLAARERRIVRVDDAYDPQYEGVFNPDVDRKTGFHTRSVLVVPILGHEQALLGCFQSINRLDQRYEDAVGVFTDEDVELLTAMAGFSAVAVENARLFEEQKRQFRSMMITLAGSVDARDPTTSKHTMYVTGVSVALAKEMGLSEKRVELIRIAAILHDYGKIGVPDNVLLKNGPLDNEEVIKMRSHVLKTALLLSRIEFGQELAQVPSIAAMHHEKLDGTGYPFGLRAEEIPLEGRVIAVADVFHALTQARPYKPGRLPEEALRICYEMSTPHTDRYGKFSGAHLDPNCVAALDRVLKRCGFDMAHFEHESGWEEMLGG
jgi:putative nucleotidyltransferase with HDIG domain